MLLLLLLLLLLLSLISQSAASAGWPRTYQALTAYATQRKNSQPPAPPHDGFPTSAIFAPTTTTWPHERTGRTHQGFNKNTVQRSTMMAVLTPPRNT